MLSQYSAIIDLSREKVSLISDDLVWTTELIGSQCPLQDRPTYYVREVKNDGYGSLQNNIKYHNSNEEI